MRDITTRFLIYRSSEARDYLCVCAARDRQHALKVARQVFTLPRTAYAVSESGAIDQTGLGVKIR